MFSLIFVSGVYEERCTTVFFSSIFLVYDLRYVTMNVLFAKAKAN